MVGLACETGPGAAPEVIFNVRNAVKRDLAVGTADYRIGVVAFVNRYLVLVDKGTGNTRTYGSPQVELESRRESLVCCYVCMLVLLPGREISLRMQSHFNSTYLIMLYEVRQHDISGRALAIFAVSLKISIQAGNEEFVKGSAERRLLGNGLVLGSYSGRWRCRHC